MVEGTDGKLGSRSMIRLIRLDLDDIGGLGSELLAFVSSAAPRGEFEKR